MHYRQCIKFCCFLLLLPLTFVAASAQDATCPAIVEASLVAADQACGQIGSNQICYGNITLDVVPQTGINNLTFNQAGDMVSVTDVKSLALSSMDASTGQWGVAVMKLRANIPDTLPGQNVTFLLFGDVEIQSDVSGAAVEPTPTPAPSATPVLVQVTASQTVNVRSAPNGAVIGALPGGQAVQADGQDTSSTWLHIHLTDGSQGWVAKQVVTVTGDADLLPVMTADDVSDQTSVSTAQPTDEAPPVPAFGPMQAFYFKTGIGINDRPCVEAPDSGILIQSPQGTVNIVLNMNGVEVALGSTVYIRAQPDADMIINVLEGQARATAFGRTIIAPAGTRLRVPLDANLAANGQPIGPEPYDNAILATLPVTHLPDAIAIAPALTEEQIESLTPLPRHGTWRATVTQAADPCPDYAYQPSVTFEVDVDVIVTGRSGSRIIIDPIFTAETPSDIAGGIMWPFNGFPPKTTTRNSDNAYVIFEEIPVATIEHVIHVVTPTHIEGRSTVSYRDPDDCILTTTYTMDYAESE